MNIQQTEKLIDRIKTIETLAENANNEWLLGWFTPTTNNLSTEEVVKKRIKRGVSSALTANVITYKLKKFDA